MLAEIVAESVCRKALTLEAKNHPYDFPWADYKRPDVIAEDVFSQMQLRLRDFVAAAHSVMLRDSEIKEIQAINKTYILYYSSFISKVSAIFTGALNGGF